MTYDKLSERVKSVQWAIAELSRKKGKDVVIGEASL